MYIKRYTIAALVFMVAVGWYVYAFITQQAVSMDLFGIHLPSLPIAFWAVVPVLVLYLASVAHMSYYSIIGSFKLRKYQKDYDLLVEAIIDAYLGKQNREHHYKTERYALMGSLVDNSIIAPNETLESVGFEKVDAVLDALHKIRNGESAELKKFNLGKENHLVVHNALNRIKNGELNPEDVISKSDRYSMQVCHKAFEKLCETAPLYAIDKYKQFMSKDSLFIVFGRINADEETLEIPNDMLMDFISLVEMDEKDFIRMSATLSGNMLPDQRIKLLEMLSEKYEDAVAGHLHTLFDLEMIAPADEILETSQPNEFLDFKAYRALKECNKPYDINLFV